MYITIVSYFFLYSDDQYPTFPEFVNYLVDSFDKKKGMDLHWSPQHQACRPCSVQYDFIGHYETLYTDSDLILQKLAPQPPSKTTRGRQSNNSPKPALRFPRFDQTKNKSGSAEHVRSMFANVPVDHVRKLVEMYSMDYKLFGYTPPSFG
jgi:dermatan 4-sulfotransferase 1